MEVKPVASKFTQATPLEKLPTYLRGGHIVPRRERVRRSSLLMKDDPYTLLVVLDKNGKAEGMLYADDGETLAHEQGYYVLRKFTFADSKLTVSKVNVSDVFPSVKIPKEHDVIAGHARIERVIVVGYAGVKKVTLEKRGTKKDLQFDNQYYKNGISIKQPAIDVESLDWTITLA